MSFIIKLKRLSKKKKKDNIKFYFFDDSNRIK